MNQTEDIKDLVAALSKAQGQMQAAKFNKKNPFFGSGYANFASCMDACKEPLSSNGIAVMQFCETIETKLHLVTMLAHTSGQYVKGYYPLTPKSMDSQAVGSAVTYAKRYGLSAMLGIVADEDIDLDDDGNAADGLKKKDHKKPKEPSLDEIVKQNSQLSVNINYDKEIIKKDQFDKLMNIMGDNKNNKELHLKINEDLSKKGIDKMQNLTLYHYDKFKEDLQIWIKEINMVGT